MTAFYGVDEKKKKVYFQAADRTPIEKRVFEIGYKGKNPRVLDMRSGTSNATFSSTYDYYILSNSTLNTPATYNVYTRGGELVRALEDNKIKPAGQPKLDLKTYGEDKDLEYVLSVTELPKVEVKSIESIRHYFVI